MNCGPCSASTASSGMSATYGINHTTSRHNLFEVEACTSDVPQGSSLLATLGFVAESLWDSCSLASFKIRVRRSEDGAHFGPAVTDPLLKVSVLTTAS